MTNFVVAKDIYIVIFIYLLNKLTTFLIYTILLQAIVTYKVHKLRLPFIPEKLQRNHTGRVCALRCHQDRPFMFISGAWDDTLRVSKI